MKRALIILFLFLLPTLLLMEFISLNSTTGVIINEFGVMRIERLGISESLPYGQMDTQCHDFIRTIERYVRLGADGRYYSPAGLINNPAYFMNERALLTELTRVQDADLQCPPAVKQRARLLEQQIVTFDIDIGNQTIRTTSCAPEASWYFDQAVFLSKTQPILAINYLEHALSLC